MSPEQVLTAICIGVSGWTLVKVVRMGEMLSAIRQRLRDLPCNGCKIAHDEEEEP